MGFTRFQISKLQICWKSLVAGCILAFTTSAYLHRRPVDLNMDGAPAAMVPGYMGPLYSAKGKLVGYAQPPVVNLESKLKSSSRRQALVQSLVAAQKFP